MKKNAKFTRSVALIAAVFAVGSLVETIQAATTFTPPNAGAPKTRIGGGVRGGLWVPPNAGAPKTRIGGGVRGVNLVLPKVGAPKTRVGGGVRGANWVPPVAGAPKTRIGGGVRGALCGHPAAYRTQGLGSRTTQCRPITESRSR